MLCPALDTIRAKLYRSTGLSNRSQRPNLKLDGTEPEHPARIHNMLNQQSFCRSTRPNQLPNKGSPEAITSVIRGDTQLYYLSVNLAVELHNAGKVRVIAVSTPKRSPALPDVPTVAESGLPDYDFDSWFGVLAPAGVPDP